VSCIGNCVVCGLNCVYNYNYCIVCCYVVGGCMYSESYRNCIVCGLNCVHNYSYCTVCFYVVGGCMYSELYRELYCACFEYCNEFK
jgi:hypothetical protein